jgi:hypothetical protein
MALFAVELNPKELPPAVRLMTEIVGWEFWRGRIEPLQREADTNPFWRPYVLERHGLELAFGDMRRHLRATGGRCRWPPQTAGEYRISAFLAVAVRVHARLSAAGKVRFAGALRSALEKEHGLGPLAFEMQVVAHLMSKGFDVDFHDLESGSGYDFLATRGSAAIEVECKHVSADAGRQIHRSKHHALGGLLRPVLEQAVSQKLGGQLLRVTLPDRLTGNREQQQEIVERIAAAMLHEQPVHDEVCAISRIAFPLEQSPFQPDRGYEATMAEVPEYLKTAFNIVDSHLLLHWSPGRSATVVVIESRKPDRVLDRIVDRLKINAKQQFSRERPAMLCVHFADLTEGQLRELASWNVQEQSQA